MVAKISLEAQKKSSEKIVLWFLNKVDGENLDNEQLITLVYNSAINDVDEALQVYIDKNPQHAISLKALKLELYWMPLIK